MAYFRYPDYYKKFRCSGSACSETCCQKWEIDIDDKTLNYWNSLDGATGDYIRANITQSQDGSCCIKMNEHGYCPFLDENHLCSLYIKLGQEHLSDICNEHPRFYNWYFGGTEAGMGICCEEVAKLVLNDDTFALVEEVAADTNIDEADAEDVEDEEYLFEKRSEIRRAIFENREDFNPLAFANIIMPLACTMQEEYDSDSAVFEMVNYSEQFIKPENIQKLANTYLSLEIISEEWKKSLQDLQKNIAQVMGAKDEFLCQNPCAKNEYASLYWYFIYRYFTKNFDDYDIVGKVNFATVSVLTIYLLDVLYSIKNKKFTYTDQVNICKMYSQEIEYDTDNMECISQFLIREM